MSAPRVYRTEAVVLRRHDFGEADRILTLYTPRHGKLRAIAKGVRRPASRLGGHVELFTHASLLVAQGRNLDIITQAETVRPCPTIRDDLWKAAYACYAAELVDRFTEDRLENEPVFDLLLQVFAYLDALPVTPNSGGEIRESTGDSKVDLAMRNFDLRLLAQLGYSPELYRCVHCGERLTPGENRFSAASGGVLCATCGDLHLSAPLVSVNAIKAMRLLSSERFGIFERIRLGANATLEIERALRAHVNYILERQPRTTDFLDRMKAEQKQEARAATRRASAPAPPAAALSAAG